MSVTYGGNAANYPLTTTVIDDGDLPAAATIAPADEAVLDRTAYMADRLIGPQVVVPLTPCNIWGLSEQAATPADRFMFSSVADLGVGWLQVDVTDAGALTFHLNPALPRKCKITSVEVRFACLNQASLPATMPQISLIKSDSSTMVTATILGTKVDASNEATFESSHIVYLDCNVDLTPAADIDYDSAFDIQYFLSVNGQLGGGAAVNKFMLKQLYCIIEVP